MRRSDIPGTNHELFSKVEGRFLGLAEDVGLVPVIELRHEGRVGFCQDSVAAKQPGDVHAAQVEHGGIVNLFGDGQKVGETFPCRGL